MKSDLTGAFSASIKWRRIVVTVLLLLWCAALVIARFLVFESDHYVFLIWNLCLAMVPLFASTLLAFAGGHSRLETGLLLLWLLFFPNAPYLLTDLIHLDPTPPVPEWYDLALLLSCAGTGLFLGYLSLLDIQAWVEARLGRLWGWGTSVGVLFLSAYGIYLGRFLRLNSWDVLIAPKGVLSDIVFSLTNPAVLPRAVGVTLLFGVLLTLGFLAFQTLADSRKR